MLPYKNVTKSDNIAVNLSFTVENIRETLLAKYRSSNINK